MRSRSGRRLGVDGPLTDHRQLTPYHPMAWAMHYLVTGNSPDGRR